MIYYYIIESSLGETPFVKLVCIYIKHGVKNSHRITLGHYITNEHFTSLQSDSAFEKMYFHCYFEFAPYPVLAQAFT